MSKIEYYCAILKTNSTLSLQETKDPYLKELVEKGDSYCFILKENTDVYLPSGLVGYIGQNRFYIGDRTIEPINATDDFKIKDGAYILVRDGTKIYYDNNSITLTGDTKLTPINTDPILFQLKADTLLTTLEYHTRLSRTTVKLIEPCKFILASQTFQQTVPKIQFSNVIYKTEQSVIVEEPFFGRLVVPELYNEVTDMYIIKGAISPLNTSVVAIPDGTKIEYYDRMAFYTGNMYNNFVISNTLCLHFHTNLMVRYNMRKPFKRLYPGEYFTIDRSHPCKHDGESRFSLRPGAVISIPGFLLASIETSGVYAKNL